MENELIYVPFEKPLVDALEQLLEIANKNGSRDIVTTSQDWETVEWIVRMWQDLWPLEWDEFKKSIQFFRQYQESNISKENEAMLEHKLEIPIHFHNILKVIFRQQNFDRQFVSALVKNLPQFLTT